jgi:hypothetical protein
MLPSVLLTAIADVTIDFLTDVTSDTVKKLKRHPAIPPYRHTNVQHYLRYCTLYKPAENFPCHFMTFQILPFVLIHRMII